jgi:oxygen-independent coproporphyrinogen-3 oxidase
LNWQDKKSLYIHIPFCRKKCLYCDFYSQVYQPYLAKEFVLLLRRQIEQLGHKFFTIYVGGGTPTVLDMPLLKILLNGLSADEFTVEANPESISKDKLNLLLDCGVNRISIGVQSLLDEKLKKLGRIHSGNQAINAILLARACGFANINIDLIFGVWEEKFSQWQKELNQAVGLPVQHISVYGLSYEKHTALCRMKQAGKITPLNDELTARMYKYSLSFLPQHKFKHYEISNFALAGYACKHNLNYWDNGEYFGLGPSAAAYQNGRRSRNIASIEKFIQRVQTAKSVITFRETLTIAKRINESACLKIRTKSGINFTDFSSRFNVDLLSQNKFIFDRLVKQGLLRYFKRGQKIIGVGLTTKGFLYADQVTSWLV